MKFSMLVSCGILVAPSIAGAIEVPQGEQERKTWCIQYGAPAEPRKPKFMTGSELRQQYWKDQLGEAEMNKQRLKYEAELLSFSEKSKANDQRLEMCRGWGYRANS